MPEIILGRDDDVSAAARELLGLAGRSGTVEVRTGRAGPAFEVDDATYGRWQRKHKPSDDERAVNATAAALDDQAAEHAVAGAGEVPDAARSGDPADVGDEITGDEVPDAAVNPAPPQNGDQVDDDDDQGDQGDDDEQPAEQGDEQPAGQPAEQPARKSTARKATTRSRSGSGK